MVLYWLGVISQLAVICSFIALVIYACDTRRMKQEQLLQGSADRRPFFNINDSQGGEPFGSRAILCNVGKGVAYKVSWVYDKKLVANFGSGLGSIAAGMRIPLFQHDGKPIESHMLEEFPVHIDYQDSAGKHYWTKIRKDGRYYFIETDETE